jgi:hypothetical protein
MALGLPGFRVGGPIYSTGEPLREYNFSFRLEKPVIFSGETSTWTKFLFSELFLLYISNLAEKVNLPSDEFQMGQVKMSVLQLSFPQSFVINTFSVQYLEDELMSVYRFHSMWQNCIRGLVKNDFFILNNGVLGQEVFSEGDQGGGLQFEELGKVCCSVLYAPSKKMPTDQFHMNSFPPVEIPLGGEVFPYVFPSSIARGAGDKAGSNLSKTTVTYTRVPDISRFSYSRQSKAKVSTKSTEQRVGARLFGRTNELDY